jgi:hypothetical protein
LERTGSQQLSIRAENRCVAPLRGRQERANRLTVLQGPEPSATLIAYDQHPFPVRAKGHDLSLEIPDGRSVRVKALMDQT